MPSSLAALLLVVALGPQSAPPDVVPAASRLVEQAERELAAGDYAAAARHARDAAEVFRSAGAGPREAFARNKAGQAALYAADYASAETDFRAAVQLSEAANDAEGSAEQLGNLGNVHFFTGRYAEASRVYDAALAIVGRHAKAPWSSRRRRILLSNRAVLLQRLGRDAEALEIYGELSAEATLRPAEQAQLTANRGVLYRRLGDPIKALDFYAQARRGFATDRHADGELGVMKNRAIVLALDLERFDEAELAFSDILAMAAAAENPREVLHARLYRGETALRAGRRDAARPDFDAALVLARDLDTPEEEWKALFGLARSAATNAEASARLDQSIAVIESIREAIRIPTLRQDFFSDKAEVYDEAIRRRSTTASPADLFRLIERAHSRAWRERLQLADAVTVERVQAALPRGTLVLDYWSSAKGAALVALTRDRVGVVPVAFDPADGVRLLDALSRPGVESWRTIAARISTAALPSAEWFTAIERVVVVAPGPLALVPFELLTVEGRLVVERAAVSYLPTAAAIVRPPATPARWRAPWSRQLRAFGDPATSQPALRSARAEVQSVAAALGGRATVHVGADNLKRYLSAPDDSPVLHIASHASASTTILEQSRIQFTSATGESDDYLSLREAYELPLAGVDLAVLSACDTERGAVARGEGVQSFSRAFLAAGARSTVTTLWRVADDPTADFMAVFYTLAARGSSKDEALRQTKLRFLQQGGRVAHPHYWAAFVMTGDSDGALPRVVPWTWIVAASAVAVGLVLIATSGRRATRRRRAPRPGP